MHNEVELPTSLEYVSLLPFVVRVFIEILQVLVIQAGLAGMGMLIAVASTLYMRRYPFGATRRARESSLALSREPCSADCYSITVNSFPYGMAATRLRKTFHYPADDDDIPKDLDEEGC